MRATLWVLLAVVQAYLTNADTLPTPVSLHVLSHDLRPLYSLCSSGVLSKYVPIIYGDSVKFEVRCERIYETEAVLVVEGYVTVSSTNGPENSWDWVEEATGPLFYYNHRFYFDATLSSENGVDEKDNVKLLITKYVPPVVSKHEEDEEMTLEYYSLSSYAIQIGAALSKIAYESDVVDADILETSFSMKNGEKVLVTYDRTRDLAEFSGIIYTVKMKYGKLVSTRKYQSVNYAVGQPLSGQISADQGVYGIMVFAADFPRNVESNLKVHRDILLRDLRTGRLLNDKGAVGVIKYGGLYTVDTFSRNGKLFTRLSGELMLPNGERIQSLCLYEPDEKGETEPSSQSPLFFSCDENQNHRYVLLQNHNDYIVIIEENRSLESISNLSYNLLVNKNKQPYIQYTPFKDLQNILKVLSDALKNRCAEKSLSHILYRLFANIHIIFDCKTNFASLEGVATSVVYDSNNDAVIWDGGDSFSLCQVYPHLPGTLPVGMEYVSGEEKYISTDLRSLEDDMKTLRRYLLESWMPSSSGVVLVDKDVLFAGKLISRNKGGARENIFQVLSKVLIDQCVDDCLVDYELYHDGEQLNDVLVSGERMPAIVNWPEGQKTKWSDYTISYVKLSTFLEDLKNMVAILDARCAEKNIPSSGKLTIFYKHPGATYPAAAYYECELKYIFFYSDFKAIKIPKVFKRSFIASVLGITDISEFEQPDNEYFSSEEDVTPKEEELRKKYPDLIVSDLLFDVKANLLNSRTIFLDEVYALKALTSKQYDNLKIGNGFKRYLQSGASVRIYA